MYGSKRFGYAIGGVHVINWAMDRIVVFVDGEWCIVFIGIINSN
jgi:hypothetical protein